VEGLNLLKEEGPPIAPHASLFNNRVIKAEVDAVTRLSARGGKRGGLKGTRRPLSEIEGFCGQRKTGQSTNLWERKKKIGKRKRASAYHDRKLCLKREHKTTTGRLGDREKPGKPSPKVSKKSSRHQGEAIVGKGRKNGTEDGVGVWGEIRFRRPVRNWAVKKKFEAGHRGFSRPAAVL